MINPPEERTLEGTIEIHLDGTPEEHDGLSLAGNLTDHQQCPSSKRRVL